MTVPLLVPPCIDNYDETAAAAAVATTTVAASVAKPTAVANSTTTTIALGTPWPESRPMWVFGYGSIIYRVDFPIEDQVFGFIRGRKRAFLQESHDHRGTEENPGRVCTLIPALEWNTIFTDDPTDPDVVCWGMAYRVKAGMEQQVKAHLDYREKDGYSIDFVDLYAEHGQPPVLTSVMVYVGVSSNPSFAGASSIEDTAKIIAMAKGPSGTNREYLYKLCASLRAQRPDALDPYLEKLEKMVRKLAGIELLV
ncbi:ChaC-like protein-domain-containing protein [Coemansia spiralis]|nr:ChaC-like protein-domain-containing protein [Coemansia spiralis]